MDLPNTLKRSFLEGVVKPSLAVTPGESFLIILDAQTRSMVDMILTAPELTALGIYGIEVITQPRKAFPNLHGLYFLSPTLENLSLVQGDFYPQKKYRSQHLYFSRRVSDQLMQELSLKSFAKGLRAFKEFLFDFFPLGKCLYSLPYGSPTPLDPVDSLAALVMSVPGLAAVDVMTLNDSRYSKAQSLGNQLSEKLNVLINNVAVDKRQTTVRVYLFERSVDLVTPLVHLLYYEPLMCDLLWDQVEVYPRPLGPHPASRVEKNDSVFEKFRWHSLEDVMVQLPKDFEAYTASSDAAKLAQRDSIAMTAQDLKRVLGGVDIFNKTMGYYNLHSDSMKSILAEVTSRNIQRLSSFEVTISTGVNAQSDMLDLKRKKELTMDFIRGNTEHPDERLRLALIAAGSLYKDITSLPETFDEADRALIAKFRELVKVYGKLISKAEKYAYRELVVRKGDRLGQSGRYLPKSEYHLIRSLEQKVTADWNTKRVEPKKEGGGGPVKKEGLSLFRARGQGATQTPHESRLAVVVYFTGGISVNEICELERYLAGLNPPGGYLVGGEKIWNPRQFIDEFVRK